MSDVPGFFDAFKKDAVMAYYEVPQEVPEPKARESQPKISFTHRDWEVLNFLLSVNPGQMTDLELSNSTIGKALGMTNGQASARVKRLVQLGLIQVFYQHWSETGKSNRRIIHVLRVPDEPLEVQK